MIQYLNINFPKKFSIYWAPAVGKVLWKSIRNKKIIKTRTCLQGVYIFLRSIDNYKSLMVFQLSVATIINYYKLSDLREQKFIVLQLSRSVVWDGFPRGKMKVLAGLCSSSRLQKRNCFPAFSTFRSLPAFPHSWWLPSIFRSHDSSLYFHHSIFSEFPDFFFVPFLYRDLRG